MPQFTRVTPAIIQLAELAEAAGLEPEMFLIFLRNLVGDVGLEPTTR